MIHIEDLKISYGDQKVVDGLTVEFNKNTFYGIAGASGIGKTTVLGAIARLVKYEGKITLSSPKIGYIFQEPRLFPWMTALENVACVCDDKEKAKYFLELLLPDSNDKYPSELSGGMKQRVAFVRSVLKNCPVLILDEPTKELDSDTVEIMLDIIGEEAKKRLVITVTHDDVSKRAETSKLIRL